MLFMPAPPLSVREQIALAEYSQELHNYTLGLWTECVFAPLKMRCR
jgi:hypothetical protein